MAAAAIDTGVLLRLRLETMRKGLAAAVKGDVPKKRDRMPEPFAELGSSPGHDDILAMNRSLNPLI